MHQLTPKIVSWLPKEYIAGFFDGEGSIGIYNKKKTGKGFVLRTQLTQNKNTLSKNIMQYLKNLYGGNISEQKTLSHKIKFNWQLTSDSCVQFLEDILPFLILKKSQAQLAINWQKNRPKRIRDEKGRIQTGDKNYYNYSAKISDLMKILKRGNYFLRLKNISMRSTSMKSWKTQKSS